MSTYYVVCEQDEDGWWVGEVRGVQGVLTQGRSLSTIRKRIRDALSLAVDDAADAEIELVVKVNSRVQKKLRALSEAQRELEKEQRRAKAIEREVAHELAKIMSVRDAGEVLHLTGQRVQQLSAEFEHEHRRGA